MTSNESLLQVRTPCIATRRIGTSNAKTNNYITLTRIPQQNKSNA